MTQQTQQNDARHGDGRQAEAVRSALRLLAQVKPAQEPFISLYLDMRTDASGTRPAATFLRTSLERQSRLFGRRGPALESYRADRASIETYLREEVDVSQKGLAIFACSARRFFQAIPLPVAPENRLTVAQAPRLYQLARLVDDYATYCVAVISRTRARVFTAALGALHLTDEMSRSPHHVSKTLVGGWAQGRYQRHVEHNIQRFAGEVAAELRSVWDRYTPAGLVLAGEEVALTALKAELGPELSSGVLAVASFDADIPEHRLLAGVLPVLERAERAEEEDAVRALEDAAGEGEMGVLGVEPTLVALEQGQVDELIMSTAYAAQGWRCQSCLSYGAGGTPSHCPYCQGQVGAVDLRESMVGAAERTGAVLEFVPAGTRLDEAGGVGALLRYPLQ